MGVVYYNDNVYSGGSSSGNVPYTNYSKSGTKNYINIPDSTLEDIGITFTAKDGIVTANGTCTALSSGQTSFTHIQSLEAGRYTFSGLVGGGTSTYFLMFMNIDTGDTIATISNDEEVTATIASDSEIAIYCTVKGQVTVENVQFKPMIRDAADNDKVFRPYAMTNRELTIGKDTYTDQVTQSGSTVTFTGLNPDYGYDLYLDTENATGAVTVPMWTAVSKSIADNLLTLTYTMSGGSNSTKYRLRILK